MNFYDDELDSFLSSKLKLIQPTEPRDPEIARQRRDEFVKKTKYLQFGKPLFWVASLLSRKPWQGLFSQRPALVPFAAAVFLIFGLVFGSWGTVYAAQDSLPNDLLYSVKLAGENLQLAFTADTEARISLLTAFTDRRVEEAKALALEGQPIPEELPARLDEQLEELSALTASLEEVATDDTIPGVQVHLHDRDQGMTNAMNGNGIPSDSGLNQLRTMLQQNHQLTQKGLVEPNEFQNRFRFEQQSSVSVTDTLTATATVTPTVTITPTITVTPTVPGPGITVTRTITPSQYGPGWGPGEPCELLGECTPPGNMYGPDGTPEPGDYGPGPCDPPGSCKPSDAYGPGSGNGTGPLPSETPDPGDEQEPIQTPVPGSAGSNGNKKGNP